jgi:hypothetical protein
MLPRPDKLISYRQPHRIVRPDEEKAHSYCTAKGLGLTVGALPSRPSPQTYQLPADAGVGT